MSFQAYLDTVFAKTGKTPADFALLAQQKNLTKHGELVTWLKNDFALGHGHANAVVAVLLKSESRATPTEDKLGKLFAGKKAVWQPACAALLEQIKGLGRFANTLSHFVLSLHCKPPVVSTRFPRKSLTKKPSSFLKFALGDDVVIAPVETYINILRGKKKFAILQISTPERIDLGLKCKSLEATDRLELTGTWNAMVTHRVKITDPSQLDARVLEWLGTAYTAARSIL